MIIRPHVLLVACALAAPLAITGCGNNVQRTDPNAVRDLSGNWNAADARLVTADMISDVLSRGWLPEFTTTAGRKPVVKVGTVVNRTSEDISTNIITDVIAQELLNSSKVRMVQSKGNTEEARDERKDQAVNASAETKKESFQEVASDFLLSGAIETQNDQAGSEKQKFYQIKLTLVDVKTQENVWIRTTPVAKDINRAKYK